MPTPFATRWNLDAIEAAYRRWRQDPTSVDESWRLFFEGYELGAGAGIAPAAVAPSRTPPGKPCTPEDRQCDLIRLINAYRRLGHLLARLDPLSDPPASIPLLELGQFGLGEADLDHTFDTSHFVGMAHGTLRELLTALRETYCRTIGVEYMHIQNTRVRRWLQERMEPCRNRPDFDRQRKLRILRNLHGAEQFELFLHATYVGQKRFSLEGTGTLIPLLDALVERAADQGVKEIILGMSHRGRLNVLANVLGKPLTDIFNEFEDNYLPLSGGGDGDVRYHLGFSADRTSAHGYRIHLSLSPNPSHLEAVDPVVEGRTRAKQDLFDDRDGTRGMPVLLHGDASFAGQGVVAETLNLSQLAGYRTGGTVHVVINNQIGFTTAPADARSTPYCTDIAKMLDVPIFHVNAEDPEAAVFVTELAFDFRQTFHRDVVIDLIGYRRHGHNEGDEPAFTQPLMYARIGARPNLSQVYTEELVGREELSQAESAAIDQGFQTRLAAARDQIRGEKHASADGSYGSHWSGIRPEYAPTPVDTGVPMDTLRKVAVGLNRFPEGFQVHPKILRQIQRRMQDLEEGKAIDWAFAEALAFGSLLLEGTSVRLSGQDSRRGTFSQRHAVLVDVGSGKEYCPLDALAQDQAPFFIYDSPLSEAAVLGFEFGYSLDAPDRLVLWEAQFGDFANGAQVIVDQFLVCSRSKWQRDSGLVLLLPHGYEGQGPEHSNARLERFLQLCAEDNIQVCNVTTPAQYFHLLRRQMHRDFRRPLIVMTPKSLLRHRQAVSAVEEFTPGHSFQEILAEKVADPDAIRRVLFSSGKIYYDLAAARGDQAHVAIVRIEQFYPLAEDALQRSLQEFRKASEFVWVQEEPRNMGGWSFMEPRLRRLGLEVEYVGRDAASSPATGSRQVHLGEQKAILEAALSGEVPYVVHAPTAEANDGKPAVPAAAGARKA